MTRQKYVAGNWKMHGSLATNQILLESIRSGICGQDSRVQVAVCVPYPYIAQTRSVLADTPVAWGAQDVSEYDQGAYTGEVSAAMLRDWDCQCVIIGHSERRTLFGDTDERVAAKTAAALKAGLQPIVCVGETLDEREAGITDTVVLRQLDAVLACCGTTALAQAKAVIAYEPVWAIGTGKTATSAQAQAVHAVLRGRIAEQDAAFATQVQIIYGGSVKPSNAAELFGQADIDGGLIGGAALSATDFLAICAAAQ
jgi:triosephosphate isomerase